MGHMGAARVGLGYTEVWNGCCAWLQLPMVAGRGSEVRGKSDKGDKPRKGEAQRCAGVCRGAQKGARGGAQAMKGPGWQKSGSTWVPRSWKMGKWVWWAHRRYSNHRINGATRAGLW